jgi:hypothetical protein
MPALTAIINWAQTSPTGGGSLALIALPAGIKLLRAEVHGAITNPIATSTVTGTQFSSPLMWGIQAIPHGNTPLVLPNNITAADWLTVEAHQPSEIVAAWAPSSATVAIGSGGGFSLKWSGQAEYAAATDVLFSDGQATGFSTSWESFGTLKLWYD